MIKYCTYVKIPESPLRIGYSDAIMLMGSCFADNIGTRMQEGNFRVIRNPFGVLYNPLSVASACRRLLDPHPFTKDDLVEHDGMFHSFAHHGSFSDVSATRCLDKINKSLEAHSLHFSKLSYMTVTFGTSYVYRLKEGNQVVANCHKLPEAQFVRQRLTVEEILEEWRPLLGDIWKTNPDLRIIFTVSPIRHLRDGAHQNQISKAVLLLSQQLLQEEFPEKVSYFPAYELMNDELRDYRFYEDDLIHPSPVAIEYIWERFRETYMDMGTREIFAEVSDIHKALNHKLVSPNKEAYRKFLSQTLLKVQELGGKHPEVCLTQEMAAIKEALL